MQNGIGPTLRRWMLGRELNALRLASRITTERAADVIGRVRTHVVHIEVGRNVPNKLELEALLKLYDAADRLEELEELRVAAKQRGWWYGLRLPDGVRSYLGLESDAIRVRCFALELVPGLLQTAEYIQMLNGVHGGTEEHAKVSIAARMRRQERVTNGEMDVSLVASEALLHRTASIGQVGMEQLGVLQRHATDQRNVSVRVLPYAVGAHCSMAGAFSVLTFPPGTLGDVAYLDYSGGGHIVNDGVVVARLASLFDGLSAQALSVQETARMLSWCVNE